MSELYFPYREKKVWAQERVITVSAAGLEIYYLADPYDDEPTTTVIGWEDILYVEPLRFTTKKYASMDLWFNSSLLLYNRLFIVDFNN